MAVIELDLGHPSPARPARPPVRVYRPLGLLLTAVLTLALGGATPFASQVWHHLGAVPLSAADGFFTLSGDRVITVADNVDDGTVTAWRTDPVRQLWTTTIPADRRNDGAVNTGFRVADGGDMLLMRTPGYRTVAIDAVTGRTRWKQDQPVEVLQRGFGLITDLTFRPGAEYDRSSGNPGFLYLAQDGRPYAEPPLRTALHGVDLTTGRTIWTHRLPGSVFTAMAGPVVVVVASDRLQLLNPENGHLLAERRAAGLSGAEVVGDVLVVRQDGRFAGYGAWTLDPLWTAPEAGRVGDDLTGGRCDDVLCRRGPLGVEVADPATGRILWRAGREVSLRRLGPVVLETDNLTQRPLRLLDTVTGEVRADLERWQTVTPTGPALLYRVEPGGREVTFGIVRDGTVRPLGRSRTTITECQATGSVVACRNRDELELFAYRG